MNVPDGATATAATALLICLLCFYWGMVGFFSRPNGRTPGLRAITVLGTLSGFGSLAALVRLGAAGWPSTALALVIATASLTLFWTAVACNRMRRLSFAFSTDLPEHLVQHGPYRLIRHPFYSAYLLGWLVAPVASLNLWLLLPFALMSVLYRAAARAEEAKFAASPLRDAYAEYRRRTGMFWPKRPR